jgi:hypothetical protein
MKPIISRSGDLESPNQPNGEAAFPAKLPFMFFMVFMVSLHSAHSQVLDAATATAPQAAPTAGAPSGGSDFFGRDAPSFDPANEMITWDGKTWNVNNNRLFEARLEKYLNVAAETDEEDTAYNAILAEILDILSANRVNPTALDRAFVLLPQASEYRRDAGLGDTIANQVYSAWRARRELGRIRQADSSLLEERRRVERNQLVTSQGRPLERVTGGSPEQTAANVSAIAERRAIEMQPFATRLAELNTLLVANQAKRELQEVQAKIEFQALIVQLFVQRRFQHVLIATRFYRSVFADGDDKLDIKGESKNLFAKTTGLPPTVGTVDSIANEIIRDVAEGIEAYKFLLERDELESATKRLAETFLVGEYLPEVRTLSRDDKRRALAFVQASNQLVSALEVKDYALSEKLVAELEQTAKDFDNSKPMAAIQTAKTVAAMHLAKARNAAVAGEREVLETELTAATEIWPRNPALAEISSMIFAQGDVQGKALVDFDQLLSQKNYRQIFDDKERLIAATALDPARQQQLRVVLADMTAIEGAIIRAQEIGKRGDSAGAWESAEKAFLQFPNDSKLNQLRANLTTQAAEFVRALRRAEELEERDQPGSSLAWYLQAQQQYPNSEFAKEGIERLTKQILPDAS